MKRFFIVVLFWMCIQTDQMSATHKLLVGGTELSNVTSQISNGNQGQLLIGQGLEIVPAFITPTAGTGLSLTSNATTLQYALSTPVIVANGGTGLSSTTPYAMIAGGTTSTGSLQQVSGVGSTGQVLTSNGAGSLPTWQATSGSMTLNNGNNITVTGSPVSIGGSASIAISGTTNHAVQVGNASGCLTSLGAGTNGQILLASTSADPSFVTPTAGAGLSLTSNAATLQYALSVPVLVASGGTGLSSATPYAMIAGGTTSTGSLQQVSGVGSTGQVLTSNGAGSLPTWQATSGSMTLNNGNNITVTGSPVSIGGSASIAISGTTNHAVQVGNASGCLTSLGAGTNGQILLASTSADPSFVTPTAGAGLSLTSNAATLQYALSVPVLVASGGTGLSSATPYAMIAGGTTSTGSLQQVSGVGNSGQVLTSNGTGALPTFQNGVQIANKTLTSAQIKSIRATPVIIVPAPGLGRTIYVLGAFARLNYGGATPFTARGAQKLQLKYRNINGTIIVKTLMANTSITATTDQVCFSCADVNAGFEDVGTSAAINSDVIICNSIATEIDGNATNDNTVTVSIAYIVV